MSAALSLRTPGLIKISVGQPFHYYFDVNLRDLKVEDASGGDFPKWLMWNDNLKFAFFA